MLRWLIGVFAVVILVGLAQPRVARLLRLGHLPGDVRLRLRGREYSFPFATTILLSAILAMVVRIL